MGRAPYQHFGAPTTMYREMGTQLWLEKAEAKHQGEADPLVEL